MNVINHPCNTEENEIETINRLLNNMIDAVLLLRQQHLARLNRECVRRYRQRMLKENKAEYMRKARQQKRENRRMHRLNLKTPEFK
jgi:hypothetical protein